MIRTKLAFLCTILCSIIFLNLIGDVNAKAFQNDPFGDGSDPFGTGSSSGNRMHDPFGRNNQHNSDPFSPSSHFGNSGGFGSSSFGSSGFGSDFGSNHHSSFGSSFDNDDFFKKSTTTTTEAGEAIAEGLGKMFEAVGQAAGVADKAISVTRNITDPNSPISSITFTSGLTDQTHKEAPSTNVQDNSQGNYHAEAMHLSYRPPSVINYQTSNGLERHPVYTGTLPPYVFEYYSSSNKYSNLLAGLALYNLGHVYANTNMQNYHEAYVPMGDEHCLFGVKYKYKLNDEMAVDCKTITSFTFEDKKLTLLSSEVNKNLQAGAALVNTNIQQATNLFKSSFNDAGFSHSSIHEAKSITDSKFNGRPVKLTDDMECFVSRTAQFASTINKSVPCELLETYATHSVVNSATMVKSTLAMLVMIVTYFVMI